MAAQRKRSVGSGNPCTLRSCMIGNSRFSMSGRARLISSMNTAAAPHTDAGVWMNFSSPEASGSG